jgi:hypothetical protein
MKLIKRSVISFAPSEVRQRTSTTDVSSFRRFDCAMGVALISTITLPQLVGGSKAPISVAQISQPVDLVFLAIGKVGLGIDLVFVTSETPPLRPKKTAAHRNPHSGMSLTKSLKTLLRSWRCHQVSGAKRD